MATLRFERRTRYASSLKLRLTGVPAGVLGTAAGRRRCRAQRRRALPLHGHDRENGQLETPFGIGRVLDGHVEVLEEERQAGGGQEPEQPGEGEVSAQPGRVRAQRQLGVLEYVRG